MKPKVLYHASPNIKLEMLEPRMESVRDETEGPVVFASPDKAGVTKFIVPSDDSWTRKSRFGDVHIHIISDKERYQKADKGGAIYHLNPDTFVLDKSKGGGKDEWTCKSPVIPINKELYELGLQAQVNNDVQVFFVDKNIFEKIVHSEDHGNEIIRGLESENKKLNTNYIEIPTLTEEY